MSAALEAGAKAWFDRIQSQRMDPGGKRPDGQRWQWEDITESDRTAYRALVRPVVKAVLTAGQCPDDSHDWTHRGSADDFWRECFLCGRIEDEPDAE
jgi:hypothetical protein